MGKILLLEQNVINKIAAGEVVERPSSVIKELVENSIDAGATNITVEIKQGGTTFIRVTDNGSGIEPEDILIAFERHATSKINEAEDLERITSLGFRGEALASIAAVAQVECITKTRSSITGRLIQIHGGKLEKQEEIGCPEGTTIFVRNLFYNIPARLKFLKAQSTEAGYISETINKLALGHPGISFKFINNNSVILHTNGNHDMKNVIFHVYGKETLRKMLPIAYVGDLLQIQGYIGKPEVFRGNRNHQSFFINGRLIKSNLLSRAVEDGYKNSMLINKFPIAVLNFTMNPQLLDVNVHPTKLEVRFEQESEVYEEVVQGIRETLKNQLLIPEVVIPQKQQKTEAQYIQTAILPIEERKDEDTSLSSSIPREGFINEKFVKEEQINSYKEISKDISKDIPKDINEERKAPIKNQLETTLSNIRYIGQIFSTYLLIEKEDKIFMIDQHAAHEKVMFEKYVDQFKNAAVVTQQLVVPKIINVPYAEKKIIDSHKTIFEQLGFDLEEFGHLAYAIRGVPVLFNSPADETLFLEILDAIIRKNIKNIYELKVDDIATMACRSAVKGHDKLDPKEVQELIQQLFALENPYTCPHGRPTIVSLTRYEIEKMFKRIQP